MKKDSDKNQITLVETSLQQSFNGITAKQLASDFAEVELKRADWLVSAVMFGIKCIAAKPQAKQGDFSAFLAKAIGDKDGKSLATAQRYMGLACQVIAQFANPNPENEIGAGVIVFKFLTREKFGLLIFRQLSVISVDVFICFFLSQKPASPVKLRVRGRKLP